MRYALIDQLLGSSRQHARHMQRELPCCFLKREDEERDDDDGRDERRKERLRGRFSFRALEHRTLLPALERHGAAGAALPRHGSVEALPVNLRVQSTPVAIPSRTSRSSTTLRCGRALEDAISNLTVLIRNQNNLMMPVQRHRGEPGHTRDRHTNLTNQPQNQPLEPSTHNMRQTTRNARVITNHTTQPMKLGNNCRRTATRIRLHRLPKAPSSSSRRGDVKIKLSATPTAKPRFRFILLSP